MMQYLKRLDEKKQNGSLRSLRNIDAEQRNRQNAGTPFINLSSNDYLSFGDDADLRRQFWAQQDVAALRMGACSSRLLTGTCDQQEAFESELAAAYGAEAALVLGSGYHANQGILPAVCTAQTLILADKLVHASLIDGIRMSEAKCIRFRHNDYQQLEALVEKYAGQYENIIVATESIFSMDGDACDLPRLVALKKACPTVQLYVDEAHAVGVRGAHGLGCCEEQGCAADIDFLVGTMGKAWASLGAYVICTSALREYLVNTVRPFIFTTALPPVNIAWSRFVLGRFSSADAAARRAHLAGIASMMHAFVDSLGQSVRSTSQIVPVITGENQRTLDIAGHLQREGFYIMGIRPPTVPAGASRLRISLTAATSREDVEALIALLGRLLHEY
ncbi:aminotransferase class I/II-fold pyridoxal phosphate-dependent enzyme [Desulfovibrio desulfuricans]|uniref:aminotransferase class I/II-fold pyridoxal phosphate-dependent enzyme n=1 Tax=Desulfovibrio desulfuricans TaxID=876 RepID=UPI0035B03610